MKKTISVTSIIVIIALLIGGVFLAKYLVKKNASALDTVSISKDKTLDMAMPIHNSPEQSDKLTDSQTERKAYYYDEATGRYFYYIPSRDAYICQEIISTDTTATINYWKYIPETGEIVETTLSSSGVFGSSNNELNFNFSVADNGDDSNTDTPIDPDDTAKQRVVYNKSDLTSLVPHSDSVVGQKIVNGQVVSYDLEETVDPELDIYSSMYIFDKSDGSIGFYAKFIIPGVDPEVIATSYRNMYLVLSFDGIQYVISKKQSAAFVYDATSDTTITVGFNCQKYDPAGFRFTFDMQLDAFNESFVIDKLYLDDGTVLYENV